jgi:hypothetical protein
MQIQAIASEVIAMHRNILRRGSATLSLLASMLAPSNVNASTPVQAAPGVPLGSSFTGPCWNVMTPVGGTVSSSNSHLFLSVPGGSNHDSQLPSNQAVRVVQPIGNVDLDLSIKIDSPLVATDMNTKQGLMVLSDGRDYLTFELATDGTNIHLSAETVVAGALSHVFDNTNFSQYRTPMYLRLTREGSAYVAFYSIDGVEWVQVGAFTDAKIPTSIGPFASNYNATPTKAPPVTMSVNWFNVQ